MAECDGELTKVDEAGGESDLVVRRAWIPYFNIQYYLGVDGISLSLVVLTGLVRRAGVPGLVEHRQASQGILRALLALVHQHDRRVHLARPVPVLRLLRGDAAADVLPDRDLGRTAARVRRDQVPALHAVWLRLHPGGDPDPLFLAEQRDGARFHGPFVRHRPVDDDRQRDQLLSAIDPVVGVHPVFHRFHRQAAVVSRSTPGFPTHTSRPPRRSA